MNVLRRKRPTKVAKVYQRYEEFKSQPDGMLLDFDDLLIHVAGALENAPAVAEEFRQQYRTFVVDEYQDVTPLQQRVLNAWLGERDDLTVVGDANQTIYSFTGASPDFLLDFSRTYDNATVVKLQRDYRSTPQVTDLANTVIDKAVGRAAGTRLRLEGMREPGPVPKFNAYESEEIEAKEVAGEILTLLNQGIAASEIAILYRTNFQSAVLKKHSLMPALSTRSAAVMDSSIAKKLWKPIARCTGPHVAQTYLMIRLRLQRQPLWKSVYLIKNRRARKPVSAGSPCARWWI